jgi:hypothetical protein
MQIDIDVALTLVISILVLLVGRLIIGRVEFLRTYSIPEPVVSGLILALPWSLTPSRYRRPSVPGRSLASSSPRTASWMSEPKPFCRAQYWTSGA